MWPDSAIIRHFGNFLQDFGKFLTVNFLFCKIFNLLWQICYITRIIFIVANGQILKYNSSIWSHWLGWYNHLPLHACVPRRWEEGERWEVLGKVIPGRIGGQKWTRGQVKLQTKFFGINILPITFFSKRQFQLWSLVDIFSMLYNINSVVRVVIWEILWSSRL